MKKFVFLEYSYLFDEDTFDNIYDFEKLLSKVFKQQGYEASMLNTVRGSSGGKRIVLIKKIEDPLNKKIGTIKDFKAQKSITL